MGREGLETSSNLQGKSGASNEGTANSDAGNADLERIITVWPNYPPTAGQRSSGWPKPGAFLPSVSPTMKLRRRRTTAERNENHRPFNFGSENHRTMAFDP